MHELRLLSAAFSCAIVISPLQSFANDKYWACGSDFWDRNSCWNLPGQPANGDDVFLTQSDALNRTVSYSNLLYPSAVLNNLTVNATGTGTMTLSQSQDSLASTTEIIGYDGTGTFTQTGGTNTVGDLTLGYLLTGNGTYNLSGTGSLVANSEIISRLGNGTFNQTGGSNTASYIAISTCDDVSCGSGTYTLSAGSLSVENMAVATSGSFGYFGNGIFNQSGGSVNVSNLLSLADYRGANGTYNLSGGTLQAGELGLVDVDVTGHSGEFNQTGGTVITNRVFSEFYGFSYNLSGGSLTTDTINLKASDFNQTGGTNTVSDTLTLDIKYPFSGSESHYTLSDGTLAAGNIMVRGDSAFAQTGGINTITGDLSIVTAGPIYDFPPLYGEYTLAGGKLDAASITVESGNTFNFTGGTLAVDNFNGNLVNNGGTLAPGSSPGTTHITGNYSQSNNGVFAVEIGGTGLGEFDVLDVDGMATLGGSLEVTLFDLLGDGEFLPSLGDSFDILLTDMISGTFDTYSFPMIDASMSWNLGYLTDATGSTDIVRLSVQSAPSPSALWLIGSCLPIVIGYSRRKKAS